MSCIWTFLIFYGPFKISSHGFDHMWKRIDECFYLKKTRIEYVCFYFGGAHRKHTDTSGQNVLRSFRKRWRHAFFRQNIKQIGESSSRSRTELRVSRHFSTIGDLWVEIRSWATSKSSRMRHGKQVHHGAHSATYPFCLLRVRGAFVCAKLQ